MMVVVMVVAVVKLFICFFQSFYIQANRWKKRGIAVMPNRFGILWSGSQFNTHVIIHHGDGSVSIAHGGIDMGQGINTKV